MFKRRFCSVANRCCLQQNRILLVARPIKRPWRHPSRDVFVFISRRARSPCVRSDNQSQSICGCRILTLAGCLMKYLLFDFFLSCDFVRFINRIFYADPQRGLLNVCIFKRYCNIVTNWTLFYFFYNDRQT